MADPTIALQVQTPQPAAFGGFASNPLAAINMLSEIQLRANQNQLFQQQIQSRAKAGQIMAASPDVESGLQNILKDPQASIYAADYIASLRSAQKTLLEMQGLQQTQSTTGLEATTKALAGAYNDPSMLPALITSQLRTLSPVARDRVTPAVTDLTTSLLNGLDMSSPQGIAQYRSRLLGLMTGSGFNADIIRGMAGTVAPSVSYQPTGPGGELQPQVAGTGFFGQPATASVVGPQGGGMLGTGGTAASPSGAPGGMNSGNALGAVPVGPSNISRTYQDERGKAMSEYQQSLDNDVKGGYMIMQTINEANDAKLNFKPGGGAAVYQKIAEFAQALGADQNLVDKIGNGDLSASQEFNKLMVNSVLAQIKAQLPVGSKLNQQEFKIFEDRNPNINTDPRAIEKIFQFWTKLYNRSSEEQAALTQAIKQPGFNISDWPSMWNRIAREKGYSSPFPGSAAAPQAPSPTAPPSRTSPRPALESFFR